jgi:hypothetical protein
MPYIPPIKPLPPNADAETRRRMYWEYVDLCVACNPSSFLPVGVKRRWWHLFKIEHPETSRSRLDLAYPITPAPCSRPPETRQRLLAAGVEQ